MSSAGHYGPDGARTEAKMEIPDQECEVVGGPSTCDPYQAERIRRDTGENPAKITRPKRPPRRLIAVRIERILLGAVVVLALVLAYARFTERDRVSQIDRAIEWVVKSQQAQILALKLTRDSLVANDMQLLDMMRFHAAYHAEQEELLNPTLDPKSP